MPVISGKILLLVGILSEEDVRSLDSSSLSRQRSSKEGVRAYRDVLCLFRLPSTLTVLDDRVHINLVGRGESDLVSFSVFVLARLFKDDLDLGLFISFSDIVRG